MNAHIYIQAEGVSPESWWPSETNIVQAHHILEDAYSMIGLDAEKFYSEIADIDLDDCEYPDVWSDDTLFNDKDTLHHLDSKAVGPTQDIFRALDELGAVLYIDDIKDNKIVFYINHESQLMIVSGAGVADVSDSQAAALDRAGIRASSLALPYDILRTISKEN